MALIAALLAAEADRDSLRKAAPPHDLDWAESWRELYKLVRRKPIIAAVADLHAETRKDGVLRVFRFKQRYPLTPLIVWGEVDGREIFRLGKAGATELVFSRDADDDALVGEVLETALENELGRIIDSRLRARVSEEGRAIVRYAAEHIPERVNVPDLAEAHGVSVSTLERRFEHWGLPTPGRLLLWLRVIWGLRWLIEPGRSVESVADQLGYSSGAAFRRAIKATMGGRPSPLRNNQGLDSALDAIVAECPGDGAYQRLTAIG
jgi:AraC-like DNA-binding protein